MIKHIVFFYNENKDLIPFLCEKLRSMQGKVPMLHSLEVGVDILHTERSFDAVLIVTVESLNDLEAYAHDTYHQTIIEWIKSHNFMTKIVDYEF